MFIVCFDAATTTGCCDGLVGGKPRYWSWDLRDAGEGRPQRLLYLWNFLGAYFTEHRVDRVFIEAPLNIGVMSAMNKKDELGEFSKFQGVSDEVLQFLRSTIAVVELSAAAHEIPVEWWEVQRARKAVMGRGTFPRGTAKKEVMKFCRTMLGLDPEDDNQADAIIGWLYQSALLNPRTALLTTPLFGGSR